jgi:L-malate glycosyltransferase
MTIVVISMIRDAWGGSEELWYQMAKYTLPKGHQIIHFSYEHPLRHPKITELMSLGLIENSRPGWIPSNATTGRKNLYIGYNYIRKKIRNPFHKIFHYQPDIILYNGTCYSIAREKELRKILFHPQINSIPFFIIGHLNNDVQRDILDYDAEIIKKMYARSRTVFFVSERNLETAKRHLCSDINNAAIIRNPVNMEVNDPLPFTQNEIKQLAIVGNLSTIHKGQDMVMDVLHRAHWKDDPWHLNIYGNGVDEQYLKNLAAYYHLEQKISFHGRITDIKAAWEKNHILIMPSHMEGMPLAVVEAMLCGRTCVATDVGGHREWIDDEINGFLTEGSNVNAIDTALSRAWKCKEKWEEMGKKAFEKASGLYEPEAGKKLFDLLKQ